MSSRENADQGSLDLSQDEKILSAWMKKNQDGDAESYRQLLQKVKELMIPFIANSLSKFGLASNGGQEDVLQEILLGIHLKRSTFDPGQYFLPWMYAIARYKTIDYLRRNKVSFRTVTLDESIEEIESSVSSDMDAGLDIHTLCQNLPTKQRDLLLLVKVEGLSVSEVAAKTGFSASDVKVTVHRAMKELKNQMKEVRK